MISLGTGLAGTIIYNNSQNTPGSAERVINKKWAEFKNSQAGASSEWIQHDKNGKFIYSDYGQPVYSNNFQSHLEVMALSFVEIKRQKGILEDLQSKEASNSQRYRVGRAD